MRRGSRLVEPDRIQAHDVEYAEIGGWIETLDVIVPNLVDPLPGDQLPRCLVGMEACASAHHWARAIAALGHTAKLHAHANWRAGKKTFRSVSRLITVSSRAL